MQERTEDVKQWTLKERHKACVQQLEDEIIEKRRHEANIKSLKLRIREIANEMARLEHGTEESK